MNRRLFLRQSALCLAALSGRTLAAAAAGWKEGSPLPALGGFGLEGSVPAYKGKVAYLDFWASWCGPCKVSFPVLQQWHAGLGPKGFVIVGVSVDETAAAMRDFLTRTHVTFPIVRDAAHKLVAAADVTTMPTAFLVDRAGIIRHVHEGFRKPDAAALEQKIKALLGKG